MLDCEVISCVELCSIEIVTDFRHRCTAGGGCWRRFFSRRGYFQPQEVDLFIGKCDVSVSCQPVLSCMRVGLKEGRPSLPSTYCWLSIHLTRYPFLLIHRALVVKAAAMLSRSRFPSLCRVLTSLKQAFAQRLLESDACFSISENETLSHDSMMQRRIKSPNKECLYFIT